MSATFPVAPLGELCDVLDSKRRPITKRDRVEGEFPYYGATGILGYVEGFIFDEPLVLIGEDGAKWGSGENSSFSAEGRYWVNNHAHVIRPHRQKLLDSWLIYQLNQADLSPFITGLTVPKLNQAKMREIPILVPPLDEQRRIVAVLDKAFAGIATATSNAQKNLSNARALFESCLDQIFGNPEVTWVQRSVGDIAAIKGGKRVPKGYKLLNEPTPFPYISVADFNGDGSVDHSKIRYISGQVFEQIKRYIIRKEDLYISIAGTVGKTGIVPPHFDGASLTENACRLVFKDGVSNRFFYYFTLTSSFKEQAIQQTRTAAQPKLALSRLQQIRLAVPPNETQNQLIAKFDQLSEKVVEVEEVYRRKRAALSELKHSLLQKAFAGELT